MAFSQTKTVQGFVPFLKVAWQMGSSEAGACGEEGSFIFDLIAPEDMEHYIRKNGESTLHPQEPASLVDFGSCLEMENGAPKANEELLFKLAQTTGPMFGGDDGVEMLRSWSYAAYAALLVCRIQECANRRKPVAVLSALHAVNKSVVKDADGATLFTVIDVALNPYAEYAVVFEGLPVVRRSTRDDGYEYAFAVPTKDESEFPFIEFIVVRLDHELAVPEFKYLLQMFGASEGAKAVLRKKTDLANSPETWNQDNMMLEHAILEDADIPALEALVQVMIAAHLSNVRVDVFQGNQETGFLSFDSYLSWLWYDFSRGLSAVTLGYCESCGRAFSLVGHRGIERRYCSESCKTDAKNKRTAIQRDKVRALFLEEALSVYEIAARMGMAGSVGESSIRKNLSQWVKLKHMLSDELSESDFGASPLFNRCLEERLDMDRLLSASLHRRLVQEARMAYERQEDGDVSFLRALARSRLSLRQKEDWWCEAIHSTIDSSKK